MRRPLTFVLLAGCAALVAAMLVYAALKKREAEVQQALVKSSNIVVAAHNLPIGSKLDAGSVKLARWSRDDLPPGAITNPSTVINQFTKASLVENEPIVADYLFNSQRNAGVLPLLIPTGMRAVSAAVDEVSDIAGFVLPHARVDVLVALSNSPKNGKPFAKIVLQNVVVLAVAQQVESVGGKPQQVKVVTFLVTPEQAERLSLASHEGSLRLAMRNYDDRKIVMTNGVDVSQLLGLDQGAKLPLAPSQEARRHSPRPAVKPVEVQVLRNGKSVEDISFIHGSGALEQHAAPADGLGNGQTLSKQASTGAPRSSLVEPAAHPTPATGSSPSSSNSSGAAHPDKRAGTAISINSAAGAGLGFTAPHSKTIEVP